MTLVVNLIIISSLTIKYQTFLWIEKKEEKMCGKSSENRIKKTLPSRQSADVAIVKKWNECWCKFVWKTNSQEILCFKLQNLHDWC